MSATFPAIKPTTRSFTAPIYPVKTYRALSGATIKRSFGSQPSAAILRVSFVNIRDEVTEQILAHYYETEGGFRRFALPNEIFAGMTSSDTDPNDNVELRGLRRNMKLTRFILWEYAGPPEVESIYRFISTVNVEFRGEVNLDKLL
jgi:hypothetical protein